MKNAFLLVASLIFSTVSFPFESIGQNTTTKNSLTNFEALHKGSAIQLSWTALYETDLTSHEIQKSANGSSFTNIGTLVAQNNAGSYRYTFLDASPVEGLNYYRLRTLDKRGYETFSNIIEVDRGFGRTNVMVLPNPVRGGVLNLQLSNINSGKYAISLYSNSGQKVFAPSLDLSNGSLTQTINLPQNLGRGIYFLQFSNGGDTRINKQVLLQ
ncbi:T9SS type A sorting domain-containing protein [Segetibacter sp.]|uniref:T9SS type A sorting domain-containing protein n=1 Tax=Segetibacter sp. TaxID=2231182 RepID=UPI002621EEE0|nr:T9SS type A sorting domain-containing protein [Segetibacter sp.]MCW3081564.1 type sorting protein [Segetibacter sp.]